MKAHMEIHVDSVHERKKPFNCSKCTTSFATKSHLKDHIRFVHERQRYPIKRKLDDHIAVVHEGKANPV